jgi:hypothetical protein
MSEDLATVLKRIESGINDESDTDTLLTAVKQKKIELATGERAVAIGGKASDLIIITGDNNFVTINGEKAEEIQQAVRGKTKTQYIQEEVYSTFFPVLQIPQYIYAAPCRFNDSEEKNAKKAIIPPLPGSPDMYPFLIRNGMLFAFQDLSFKNNYFREIIKEGEVERYDAVSWWEEPDRMSWYISLLNRSLNKLTGRKGLSLDREHHRYYFTSKEQGKPRRESYRPLNRSVSERNVVWQPMVKKTGNPRPYWLHLAVALKFHYVAREQWCLSIRPEFRVTKDGTKPLDSDLIGRQVTRKKSKIYNYGLLGDINFWRDYLSSSRPQIDMSFSKTQKIVISTSMMQSKVNWLGMPEEYAKPFKNVDYDADPFDEDEKIVLPGEDEEDCNDWGRQEKELISDNNFPF